MSRPSSELRIPFTGRGRDLDRIRDRLGEARDGRGGVLFVTGEGGVGKSRLAQRVAEEAGNDGWTLAEGPTYPVEQGVPYGLLAEAFVPLLRRLEPTTVAVLTRGGQGDLEVLFPELRDPDDPHARLPSDGDGDLQLFWTFTRFATGLARREPLLVVLDDVHAGDPSSLELLHFVARHLEDAPLLVVATVNEGERDDHPSLIRVERSLTALGVAERHDLRPLSAEETGELVRATSPGTTRSPPGGPGTSWGGAPGCAPGTRFRGRSGGGGSGATGGGREGPAAGPRGGRGRPGRRGGGAPGGAPRRRGQVRVGAEIFSKA